MEENIWGSAEDVQLIDRNRYIDNPSEGMKLITALIAERRDKPEAAVKLEYLHNELIEGDFLTLCEHESLPNEAGVLTKLRRAFSDLCDMTDFSALANKNIVAVGGGFSAGKSRFLNTILDDDILPTDTTPTTAIPSFITKGNSEKIYVLNTFNHQVAIDREAVKAIGHAFKRKYDVAFYHIIKQLIMEKEAFRYENIAFLDTPGYSKSDDLQKGGNIDEKIAQEHLMAADHLIWLVDVSKGTMPEADIQFLKSVDMAQPIFVVANKADLRSLEEVKNIVKKIREILDDAGIAYQGVSAFTSSPKGDQKNELAGDSLLAFLEQMNGKIKHTRVKQGIERIFEPLLRHNHECILESRKRLAAINKLHFKNSEGFTAEEKAALTFLSSDIKSEIAKCERLSRSMENLQDDILKTVDEILDCIGVKEERKGDDGVVGYTTVRDDVSLSKLIIGHEGERDGVVVKTDIFGAYVDCGLADSIMLDSDDIEAKYTNDAEEIFCKGSKCRVRFIDIDRAKKIVQAVVIPK